MKTIKQADMRKKNAERREQAIRAVRRVNPDFVPGVRYFDRPRKNPRKQRILDEMRKRESHILIKNLNQPTEYFVKCLINFENGINLIVWK